MPRDCSPSEAVEPTSPRLVLGHPAIRRNISMPYARREGILRSILLGSAAQTTGARLQHNSSDPPLTAQQAAAEVGLSLAAFWRAVGAGRLPMPTYPAPRAPR